MKAYAIHTFYHFSDYIYYIINNDEQKRSGQGFAEQTREETEGGSRRQSPHILPVNRAK